MSPRPLCRRGFTLVEMIVTCLMIGILASFAIPQYLRTVEMAKADDAVATVNMIGTTNRMFALDHGGWYVAGLFSAANCSGGTCPASVTAAQADACTLVWCNYLSDQSWTTKPYEYYACDGKTAGTCGGMNSANNVSGAKRKSGASPGTNNTPYTNWGYTMDRAGAISANANASTTPPPTY